MSKRKKSIFDSQSPSWYGTRLLIVTARVRIPSGRLQKAGLAGCKKKEKKKVIFMDGDYPYFYRSKIRKFHIAAGMQTG